MSEFDEEAERERLRERFEREERKREATERMSELLLKGATMTNAHCSECGDPVFRYDGQEFCATCQRAIEREGGDDGAEGETDEDADGDASPDNVEVTSPSADTRVQFGGAGGEGVEEEASDEEPPQRDARGQANERDASTTSGIGAAVDRDEPAGSDRPATPAPPADDAGTAVATARADLAATLARFARAARESESPAAAREHLEAARAAAETLDELG